MTNDSALSWLEPGWEHLPLGRSTNATQQATDRSATTRYGDNRGWLVRWTMYAELMAKAKYQGLRGHRTAASDDVLSWIGSRERFIHQELREDLKTLPAIEIGRTLLDEVILPAIFACNDDQIIRAAEEADLKTFISWYHALTAQTSAKAEYASTRRLNGKYADITKTLASARWERGLCDREQFPSRSDGALRDLTLLLDQNFQNFRRNEGSTFIPDDLQVLLPPGLAEKVRKAEKEMVGFRNTNLTEPAVQQGISELGRLEILEKLLPQLARRMLERKSMLILGPTSSGKSFAGRVAASYCKHRNMKAIVLMPIKALVTQAVQEWKDWLDRTGLEWDIVPGSRDYPDHDTALVHGDFDIAVMIPEKLAALIGRGMRLDNVGVIVADELQMLSEDYRGTRLEMLITRLRREHPHIPIVALAAQLDKPSTEQVRQWLDIDESAIIQASVRPVPLEKIVRGGGDEEIALLSDGVTSERRPVADPAAGLAANSLKNMNPYQRRVLTLCLDLLAERNLDGSFRNRGVLCFVQARNQAEVYADKTQSALVDVFGASPADSPYLGTFSSLTEEVAKQRFRRFSRIPQSTERQKVIDALRRGVGFHSARLDPFLREEMEWGFREGLIRLLFATDTLKLGINLPADAVVVASITTPNGGGTNDIIDRDTVAQRLGRAGRLGISQRGRGYLVIPSEPLRDGDYEFTAGDEEQLAKYIEPAAGLHTVRRRALTALSNPDAVFAHYIKYKERGARITSRLDQDTLAYLLLEHSKRIFEPQLRESLEHEVSRMFDLSLKAQQPESGSSISPSAVVQKLVDSGLLSSPEPGYLRITALGRAVGHSGIPLSDAPAIERMAASLAEGAGHLTLLFTATQTKQVVDSTTWVAIRSDLPLELEAQQKRGVIQLAQLLIAGVPEETEISMSDDTLSTMRSLIRGDDLVGHGVSAERVLDLIDLTLPDPPLSETNALLRATVLLLWMRGCPFPIIRDAVSATVRHGPDKRIKHEASPPIHPADVRNLGENTSYVFDAVSDLVGLLPENAHFRLFERMSDAVAYGLPVELTPLSRLNIRATHRDRLVHLVNSVHAERYTDIAALVRGNVRDPRIQAPSQKKHTEWQNRLFELRECKEIIEQLKARQDKSAQFGRALPKRIEDKFIAETYTCKSMVESLTGDDPTVVLQHLSILFRALGLDVESHEPDSLLLRSRLDSKRDLTVKVATSEVTLMDARAFARDGMLVVACAGVSLDVMIAPLVAATKQSVVVEPAVLVEAMYLLSEFETETTPSEFGEQDDDIDPILDPDDPDLWDLFGEDEDMSEEYAGGAELDHGVGRTRERTGDFLLQILHSAPPMMSKNDANRLLDGVRIRLGETSLSVHDGVEEQHER